jgi:uncharacterized membrane protein/predicted DsbA family dithiol-disulfide isomerase
VRVAFGDLRREHLTIEEQRHAAGTDSAERQGVDPHPPPGQANRAKHLGHHTGYEEFLRPDRRFFRVMTKRASMLAMAATIVGLAASVASAIDDLRPVPAFCEETGCQTVKDSAWAAPLGVPMSVLGVGFFAAMLVLCFVSRPRLRRALAIAGGVWAVWLVALQAFVIDAWCKLCLVADPAAIVLAASVIGGAGTLVPSWKRTGIAAGAFAAVVGALALWTRAPEAAAIETVATSQRPKTDRVTIVEMLDFECPHCRVMAKRLDDAIERAGVPVTIERKMVPLQIHENALAAALAWCCADAQGKGEEMARALLAADPEDLTAAGCEQIAARVGCDLDRYRADMPAAQERVRADLALAREVKIRALPTVIIGDQRITGASASVEELVAMIERAAS